MDAIDPLGVVLGALPYAAAFALALGVFVLLIGLYRHPLVAVILVLAVAVWEAAVIEFVPVRLGISITPPDVAFVCVFAVALLRMATVHGAARSLPMPVVVLLGMLATSFAIGASRYGTKAGVEFRPDFYFWVTCLYLLSFRPDRVWLDRMLTLWSFAAFLLCLIVWYRWAADAFGLEWFEPIWRYADATGVEFHRVAPAHVALALGVAVLVSVVTLATGRASVVHFVFLPALLLTIVFLQHRSVWVSTLLPLVLLLVLLRRARRSASNGPLVATIVSVFVVAGALNSGMFGTAADSVANQAARATSSSQGTFVARVEGWGELLGQSVRSGPVGMAIGQPYGSGFERHQGSTWGGRLITYSPHNYYVLILLRCGLVGLAALLIIFWRIGAYGLARADPPERFGPAFTAALLLCLMLHSIPYYPTAASALLFGGALCLAYRSRATTAPRAEYAAGIGAIGMIGVKEQGRSVWPLIDIDKLNRP